MNIKISQSQHEFLQYHLKETFLMGSHLYGVANKSSDRDILCVYKNPWADVFGLPNYHQFQYDDEINNIDYIYCTEEQFWANQRSGDSTINSDIVLWAESDLTQSERLELCRTYKVIKAYLGFANRDLKQAAKMGTHKVIHAQRGIYCAEELLEGRMPLLSKIKTFYQSQESVKDLQAKCAQIRENLNHAYDSDQIKSYWVPQVTDGLFQMLLNSNNTKEFKY